MAGFSEALPDEACVNFERLMVSGAKAIEFLGSQVVPALGNLVLLRRDSLLTDVFSIVPAEELSQLRHAALPTSAALLPSKLLDTALSKTLVASNDALIHPGSRKDRLRDRAGRRQPRLLLRTARVPRPWCSDNSRHRATTLPRPQPEARPANRARVKDPFPRPPDNPAAPVVNEKGPESAQPDHVATPSRVGGCLSLHWRQWQTIGAEPWVVSVLREGYRIPFRDLLPPLARSPVSFPKYRPDSPHVLALRQEVESMITKGALEIVPDLDPGFYSRLFLVEKASGG